MRSSCGYEFAEDIEQRRFAGPGSAANEDVFPGEDIVLEAIGERVVERSGSDQVVACRSAVY